MKTLTNTIKVFTLPSGLEIRLSDGDVIDELYLSIVERLPEVIEKVERLTIERCAAVCDEQYPYSVFHTDVLAAKNCAAAIRKLGEQE